MVNKVLWVHGTPPCDTLCRLRKAAWISSFNCMDGYGGIPNVQANLVPRAFPRWEQENDDVRSGMSSNGKFAEGFCNYNDNHLVLCGRLRVVSNFGERQTSKQDTREHARVLENTRREGSAENLLVACPPSLA